MKDRAIKIKPAYRCDIQEWVSENIMVNGDSKKRQRLVRVIGWGVPFLVAKAAQKQFKESRNKPIGHYILIPKHKTPEDINNERRRKFQSEVRESTR